MGVSIDFAASSQRLTNRHLKIKMAKLTLYLLALAALASVSVAASIGEKIELTDADCKKCGPEIWSAFKKCIVGFIKPVPCIEGILGTGSDCLDCICPVLKKLDPFIKCD